MRTYPHKDETIALALSTCFLIAFVLIAFFKEGTGDSGDSIEHFLISKFSFTHPELFLHHWGKPVFILLSSPFSQFGFTGIKIFNSLVAVLSGYFTYKTAARLRILHPYLSVFFLFGAPVYFIYIFSGMTEHLLGLALILSVYLIMKGKIIPSLLLVSFMPFMRSEGIVLILVFALFLLIKKKYRYLPLLLTGHIIYSLLGYFHYGDFLWIFNRIPYLKMGSAYGAGNWSDFIFKLYYVLGMPLFILLIAGLVPCILKCLKRNNLTSADLFAEELFLIYGSFAGFFIAHSLFWALGIFNSMGLGRVLNSVVPLAAIIGMRGLEWISSTRYPRINKAFAYGVTLFVILFPFLGNPASVKWNKDLDLTPDQQLIDQIIPKIKSPVPGTLYLYSHPYIGMKLGIDPFEPEQRGKIARIKHPGSLPRETVVIWDSWFSVTEEGYLYDLILSYDFLERTATWTSPEDPEKKIMVFRLRETTCK
ncbi:MAG: hypothetical protein MUC31_05085 [Bacteroidales bacterium]|nr:hypothetical protein [Bacteroidales bacterium]